MFKRKKIVRICYPVSMWITNTEKERKKERTKPQINRPATVHVKLAQIFRTIFGEKAYLELIYIVMQECQIQ